MDAISGSGQIEQAWLWAAVADFISFLFLPFLVELCAAEG